MSLLLLYAAAALFFSFLCSISEAVMLSVRRPYIAALVQQKKAAGKILHRLKENIHEPLAAILTLNTVANTAGAAGVGAQATALFGSGYLGVASGVLTLLILVFSEIIPKTVGATYWRPLAPVVGFYLKYLVIVLYPFVVLSQHLIKILTPGKIMTGFNREELASMAELGRKEGHLDAHESRILKNLFRFESTVITDIMTPRTVVFSLPETMRVADYCAQHPESPFSRIPIYGDQPDDVIGFVRRTDILLAQAHDRHDAVLKDFKRAVNVVPSTLNLSDLFELFIEQRTGLALVTDEYGSFVGLVTMEDLVETLLGLEIVDESDTTPDMQALARELWRKRAIQMGLRIDDSEDETST